LYVRTGTAAVRRQIEEATMRKITLALAAVAAAALAEAQSAEAQASYQGPWCAYMMAGRDFYTSRCDLPNYKACQQEIAATPGTWCTENPFWRGPAGQRKVKRKRS
jgi:hypothetical protein